MDDDIPELDEEIGAIFDDIQTSITRLEEQLAAIEQRIQAALSEHSNQFEHRPHREHDPQERHWYFRRVGHS